MDQGTLYIEVNAGLCNRLRAMVSAICWAERIRRKLCICWPTWKPECAADFSILFDRGQLPDWIEINDHTLAGKKQCLSPSDAEALLIDAEPIRAICIQSHGCFWPRSTVEENDRWLFWLRHIKPSQHVKNLMNSWYPTLGPDGVTVHIRRTDNQKAILLSPIPRFIERLRKIPSHIFLRVFSDDISAVDDIRREYGYRVLVCEAFRERNTQEGMIEAAAVFFALAASDHVLGSANSSFSEVACDYGGGVLEIVT